MRVMVAGATGAIGTRLVPLLVAAGHSVTGLTRSASKTETLARAGAAAVVVDALDAATLRKAALDARPEVIVHEMTAIDGASDLRQFDRAFAATNRLRTEGLDNLLAAARELGTRRFIAQSFCGWPYARTGGPVKTEEDPLDPSPPREFRNTLEAIRHSRARSRGRPGSRSGAALRRLLRTALRTFRRPDDRSPAPPPRAADRRRERLVVVPARRRRGSGDRSRCRKRRARPLQHRRRRSRSCSRMAARARKDDRRQAAAAHSPLAGAPRGRRAHGGDDDRRIAPARISRRGGNWAGRLRIRLGGRGSPKSSPRERERRGASRHSSSQISRRRGGPRFVHSAKDW